MREGRRLYLTVTAEQDGKTVDALLRQDLALSGTVIRRIKWLERGILLDGERVHTRRKAVQGQVLSALVADEVSRSDIVARPGPLCIVYEDEDILVVNKAAGVTIHPGPGHYDDTLGNFVLYHYQAHGIVADYHPVHRLDKGTSGLMVVAKHAHAQEKLNLQLHTHAFRRIYLAVCQGVPQQAAGVIDAPLGRVEGSLVARMVRPDGQAARTAFETVRVANGRALVRLELDTGRTHQIRVHMAHIGHPLVGDFLYGVEDKALIARTALHSWRLEVTQPITGVKLQFEVPLPEDMAGLMA